MDDATPNLVAQVSGIPGTELPEAAVREEGAIRYEAVEVRMGSQSRPECLDRHDDAGESLFSFVPSVAVTADLGREPSAQQAMEQPRGLPVEAAILLEAFSQAHLFGHRDDHVAIGHLG